MRKNFPEISITKIDTSLASKNSVYAPEDSSYLFDNVQSAKEFDLSNLNTSKVTDMSYMLSSDISLKKLDLSNFDTSKVTDMSYMLSANTLLQEVNLSSFNTSKVTTMKKMFYDSGLTSLNLSNFDMKSIDFYKSGSSYIFEMFSNALQQITLGPTNRFTTDDLMPLPSYKNTFDGWQNIGTGSVEKPNGNIILPNYQVSLGDLYDGTGKTGVETFVRYNLKKGDYTTLNFVLDIYLNGKKNVRSKDYSIPTANSYAQIPSKINYPDIPKDWKIDDSKTTLQINRELLTKDNDPNIFPDGISPESVLSYLKANKLIHGTNVYIIKAYYTGKDHPIVTPSSGSSTPANHNNPTSHHDSQVPLSSQIENVTTYHNKANVGLWSLNRHGSGSVTKIKDRVLAPNSDWYVDKKVTINGEDYLRVATNEWVKASQVYPYKDFKGSIRTNSGSYKYLYTAEGKQVGDRALSANTDWKSDRTINLNGTTYYRVATNEFVQADDVNII